MVERPELYLNFRLWNLNDPLGSQTPNTQMLQRICERFEFDVPTELDVRKRKSINLKARLYLHFRHRIYLAKPRPTRNWVLQVSVYGLSSHFGILVDGTVVPCCLDKEAAITIGACERYAHFRHNWDRARAQDIVKGFKQKQLVEKTLPTMPIY